MPREERLKIYTFDELSKKAKDRAIKDWRDKGYAWDYTDSQWLTELFENDLENHFGYKPNKDKVNWDLGYSQSDGVCFEGSIEWDVFLEREDVPKKFRRLKEKVYVTITSPGRSCHWNSMEVTVEDAGPHSRESGPKEWMPGALSDDVLKEFEEFIVEDVKKTSKELQKMGYAEMEYRESDEGILEFFTANEYEFLEDGRRWKK